MCGVWALTTYDACDIRCSYCASYAQGPSEPRVSADEVRRILEEQLPAVPREHLICLGPIIDCYTHAEAEHRVTRAALEVLMADDRDLVIVTKGTLIERDLDLLAGYGKVSVNVSLPSLDPEVLRLIEPQADSATERLATIERLADAGVDVQLHVQPWIPGMTDAREMVDVADGRLKVWFAPLNVQNPAVARSGWGKRFTQREVNEAYVAEMKRVGPHPNVVWSRPVWLGDDLLTLSQWGVTAARCERTGEPLEADPALSRRTLPDRTGPLDDPATVEARDLASTSQLLEAYAARRLPIDGMAKLSAHIRMFAGRYPERSVESEGPHRVFDLVRFVEAIDDPRLDVGSLVADGPVVHARFRISGEVVAPFADLAPGDSVRAEIISTYRFDTHGLVIEQWIESELHMIDNPAQLVDAEATSTSTTAVT
ncbi:MAG: radical SAM protein [Acidimicrobiia bacterium]|nr:radical SAM protein [Acidimicrobiia bacterium]